MVKNIIDEVFSNNPSSIKNGLNGLPSNILKEFYGLKEVENKNLLSLLNGGAINDNYVYREFDPTFRKLVPDDLFNRIPIVDKVLYRLAYQNALNEDLIKYNANLKRNKQKTVDELPQKELRRLQKEFAKEMLEREYEKLLEQISGISFGIESNILEKVKKTNTPIEERIRVLYILKSLANALDEREIIKHLEPFLVESFVPEFQQALRQRLLNNVQTIPSRNANLSQDAVNVIQKLRKNIMEKISGQPLGLQIMVLKLLMHLTQVKTTQEADKELLSVYKKIKNYEGAKIFKQAIESDVLNFLSQRVVSNLSSTTSVMIGQKTTQYLQIFAKALLDKNLDISMDTRIEGFEALNHFILEPDSHADNCSMVALKITGEFKSRSKSRKTAIASIFLGMSLVRGATALMLVPGAQLIALPILFYGTSIIYTSIAVLGASLGLITIASGSKAYENREYMAELENKIQNNIVEFDSPIPPPAREMGVTSNAVLPAAPQSPPFAREIGIAGNVSLLIPLTLQGGVVPPPARERGISNDRSFSESPTLSRSSHTMFSALNQTSNQMQLKSFGLTPPPPPNEAKQYICLFINKKEEKITCLYYIEEKPIRSDIDRQEIIEYAKSEVFKEWLQVNHLGDINFDELMLNMEQKTLDKREYQLFTLILQDKLKINAVEIAPWQAIEPSLDLNHTDEENIKHTKPKG